MIGICCRAAGKVRNVWLSASLLSALALAVPPLSTSIAQEPETSRAGNEKVAEIMRTFGGRGVMADDSEPTPAEQAVERFRVRDGFQVDLVAAEPTVSQPLFLSWDSRGRMWVVHYRQYQYPAGLKVIRFDQHLRAVFDKVPDPPPHGVRGADLITVHEDTDGDGRYDLHKEVIGGLNIATSVQVGNGSIWVLNPPYLLRYPDSDRDDVPDGDPEVHLSGFGLQDTHSVANSLLWGPDGWLYGSNGSTTVGDVSSAVTKGVRFQGQCVWRYHPQSKVFEIFAEGGGNTFSLEIDSKGRTFVGNNGGNTRGWYLPQGSYSRKNWGKHGPLTNPYAFGFFEPMKLEGDGRRFAQAFCIYEGGLYSTEFDGTIIAPNSMQNLIWNSRRIPDGSTYRTVDNENLVESPDRWFRPVYAGVGPDGAAYVADWYDTRLSHVSPTDDWHKESGRVYRVFPQGASPVYDKGDLHELGSSDLIALFDRPNKWVRRRSALELGWRNDKAVVGELVRRVDRGSLESLWTLHLMGELSLNRAAGWLEHDDPHIRRWTVRLLGDRHQGHSSMAVLAESESDVQVRSQLASTAQRIDASAALPIIKALISRDEDVEDLHMPLMIWWALESHADAWDGVRSLLADPEIWKRPIFQRHLGSRLMRRYAAAGGTTNLDRCAALLGLAPDEQSRRVLMSGLNQAFQGRTMAKLPDALARALDEYLAEFGDSALVIGVRQQSASSITKAIALLKDRSADLGLQTEIAKSLGEVDVPSSVPTLISLALAKSTSRPALQRVAIASLARYDDDSIPRALVGAMNSSISGEHSLRSTACRTLASRPKWAEVMLAELNEWRLRRDQIPTDVIQQLYTYQDPRVAEQVERAFGKPIQRTSQAQIDEIRRLRGLLAGADADAGAGRAHFVRRCGNCHQLFGEGKKVGPPLDGYDRGNLSFWLNAIVEPSLEIREGFQSYLVLTDDGRAINGMIAAQDPESITLRNADNAMTTISREQIETFRAIDTSLMPADVLKEMSDQQIRDLFAYLTLGTE